MTRSVFHTAGALLCAAAWLGATAGPPALAGEAADWGRRHAALDAAIGGGTGFSNATDSSTLAWAESYILASYLARYEATGDWQPLETFVRHADRVLASADDPDGDGMRGWRTARYSLSRLRGGDFTDKACALPDWLCPRALRRLPRHWRRWQSNERTAYRAVVGGQPLAMLVAAPGRGWQVLETDLGAYAPRDRFRVDFRARTGGAAGGRLDVLDRSTGRVLGTIAFSHSDWRRHRLVFDAPAQTGHRLVLRLYHRRHDVSGWAQFDDIELRRAVRWMVHDGMILWPMAAFAARVRHDPALGVRWGARAQAYLDFITTHVLPYWERWYRPLPGGGGSYVFPATGDYPRAGASQPHNQVLALGRVFVHLYRASGDRAALARARALGRTFRSRLRLVSGAYRWHYADPLLPGDPVGVRPEDLSHANIDLGFVLDMHAIGEVFDDRDTERFAATLERGGWNRSWSRVVFARYVDGTGPGDYAPYLGEWTRLGAFASSRARRLADALYEQQGWFAPAAAPHAPTAMLVAARLSALGPLRNGGFEVAAPGDASLPEHWRRWQSSPHTAVRDPAAARAGRYGLTLRTDPAHGWQVLEQRLVAPPRGTELTLRFAARTNGSAAGGRVDVLDRAAGRVVGSMTVRDSRWRRYALRFRVPDADAGSLWVRALHERWDVPGGELQLDDLSLELPPVRNGGFEAVELVGDPGAATTGRRLPAYWVRWQARPATAFVDAASAHDGRLGLTLRTDPGRGWQVLEQRCASYVPGRAMRLEAWVRTDRSAVGARLQVLDRTSGRVLAQGDSHDTAWRRLVLRFRMPAEADHEVRVRLLHTRWDVPGVTARFDGVALRPDGGGPPAPAPRVR